MQVIDDNYLKTILPSCEEIKDGFTIKVDDTVPNGAVILSENLNRYLMDGNTISLEKSDVRKSQFYKRLRERAVIFEMIIRFIGHKQRINGVDFRNESKICVCSPIRKNVDKIQIFKGDYFSSYLTNELASKQIFLGELSSSDILYNASDSYPISIDATSKQKHLLEYGEYPFGNHLGVSTLGVTKDKWIVPWIQTSGAMLSQNLLAPTGSGSCDWKDYVKGSSLSDVIKSGMQREFKEESLKKGLHLPSMPIIETIIIGFFRNLVRAGKPEFLGISRLDVSKIDLFPNQKEVSEAGLLQSHKLTSLDELMAWLNEALDNKDKKKKYSIPLWINLVALLQFLKERPKRAADFLVIPEK